MGSSIRNKRWFRLLAHACRILFALTFIFSGFVKAIDPWGTALNVNNYLAIYGMEWFRPYGMIFSIWLCGAELMMGCMLLFKVRIRLISIFAVVSMTFFTILTLLSATVVPVEDCGCFGELIHLTPMQTFLKNLVLLPMALCFWWRYRPDRIFAFTKLELILTVVFCTGAMGLGVYSYYNLPLIDLLPYKVGTNIAEEMKEARMTIREDNVVLIFKNRRTGKLKEFSVRDKAWQNERRWQWVDTRVEESEDRVEPMILEFFVSDEEGDATRRLLSVKGRLYMLCVTRFEALDAGAVERLNAVIEKANSEGAEVVMLTPETVENYKYSFGSGREVECYNIDHKTLITMLRANVGVVEMENGVITAKRNLSGWSIIAR